MSPPPPARWVFPDPQRAGAALAGRIAEAVRTAEAAGRPLVLGIPTGRTPLPVYRELVRMYREDELSFRGVVFFHLDEYWPMDPEAPQAFRRFTREHFFRHVDVPVDQVHAPDGLLRRDEIPAFCADYEERIRAAGGLDLVLLGIGRNGHIAFNEPGSARDSRTRLVEIAASTREDAAVDFGSLEAVPHHGITMGVGTILEARRVVLAAFGRRKAGAVARALEGPVGPELPASFLREHPAAEFVLDREAAAALGS